MKSKLVVIAILGVTAACSSDSKRDLDGVENGANGNDAGRGRAGGTDGGKVNGGDDEVCGKHSLRGEKAMADMLNAALDTMAFSPYVTVGTGDLVVTVSS